MEEIKNRDSFSRDEMEQDYNNLSMFVTMKEKKELGKKYGIDSGKIKDLQAVILQAIRRYRHEKTVFDEKDVKDFYLMGFPMVYNKLVLILKEEPKSFVEYLYKYMFNRMVQNGIMDKTGRVKRYYSYSEKNEVDALYFVKRYLNEYNSVTPENKYKETENKAKLENNIYI